MKTERVSYAPCVIWPARAGREERHLVHGTSWRAQRNADIFATFGCVYHVHEFTHITLYGRWRRWCDGRHKVSVSGVRS